MTIMITVTVIVAAPGLVGRFSNFRVTSQPVARLGLCWDCDSDAGNRPVRVTVMVGRSASHG